MKIKKLILIPCLLFTFACGNTNSSEEFVSNEATSYNEPELVGNSDEEKIYNFLNKVGDCNFTVKYNFNNKDYEDYYTKEYIYFDYYHDGVARVDCDGNGKKLHYVGVHYDEETVELYSPVFDGENYVSTPGEYVGIEYFSFDNGDDLDFTVTEDNLFKQEYIKKGDFGYYVDRLQCVVYLGNLFWGHNTITFMNGMLIEINYDNTITITPLLLDSSKQSYIHKFESVTLCKVGTTSYPLFDSYVNNFVPFDNTLSLNMIDNYLTNTFTYNSSVISAKKYENIGEELLSISYTNNNEQAQVYSYDLDLELSTVAYFENIDGDAYRKYLNGKNEVATISLDARWEEVIYNPSSLIQNLSSKFYQISDNVYRCFEIETYDLLAMMTYTDFGYPLYVDAVVENNKVSYFRFGFFEDGFDSNGNFIHTVIKTEIDKAKIIHAPVSCLGDENTSDLKAAIDYINNNDYQVSIETTVSEDTSRVITKIDNYFVDEISTTSANGEEYHVANGYYIDENNVPMFFSIEVINGVYNANESSLNGLEYFDFFTVSALVFEKSNGYYRLNENVEYINHNIFVGYYGAMGSIINKTVKFNVNGYNKLINYSYDFIYVGQIYSEKVNFKYDNITLNSSLKNCIDEYIFSN